MYESCESAMIMMIVIVVKTREGLWRFVDIREGSWGFMKACEGREESGRLVKVREGS